MTMPCDRYSNRRIDRQITQRMGFLGRPAQYAGKFSRIDDLEEKIGPLETILLNKDAYLNLASGMVLVWVVLKNQSFTCLPLRWNP
jgi:FAD synthase